MVRITIDTKHDTAEDIKKVISLLQQLHSASSTLAEPSSGFMNIFGTSEVPELEVPTELDESAEENEEPSEKVQLMSY